MNKEPRTNYESNELPMTVTRRGKIVGGLVVATGVLGMGMLANNYLSTPDDHELDQVVRVNPGDTPHGMIKEHVPKGGESVGEIARYVIDSPKNAETFENNQLDPGEELWLPTTWE